MPKKTSKSPGIIYQLKITLNDSHPPIWRRILVPGNFNLYKLHHVIQIAMGWTDSHLHQFIIKDECFGVPSPEDWKPVKDERQFTLEQIASSLNDKFVYEYDFGDSWTHKIIVEKITDPAPDENYPQCIKGKRACPPEDVGGVWGYENFLEAIKDSEHEEHDSYLEWVGGEFDAESFDLESINNDLRKMK